MKLPDKSEMLLDIIRLNRENRKLKSIIEEIREYINKTEEGQISWLKIKEILDKVDKDERTK